MEGTDRLGDALAEAGDKDDEIDENGDGESEELGDALADGGENDAESESGEGDSDVLGDAEMEGGELDGEGEEDCDRENDDDDEDDKDTGLGDNDDDTVYTALGLTEAPQRPSHDPGTRTANASLKSHVILESIEGHDEDGEKEFDLRVTSSRVSENSGKSPVSWLSPRSSLVRPIMLLVVLGRAPVSSLELSVRKLQFGFPINDEGMLPTSKQSLALNSMRSTAPIPSGSRVKRLTDSSAYLRLPIMERFEGMLPVKRLSPRFSATRERAPLIPGGICPLS